VFLHTAYQIYRLQNVLKKVVEHDLRLEDILKHRLLHMIIKIHHFDRSRLMEQRVFVEFRGDQRSALPRVLGGNVVADRPALIQYEAIVILFLFRTLLCESVKTTSLTIYGTCPNGCRARNSGALCSPFARSMGCSSNGTCFSCKTIATRRVHVEPEDP
jgi:hypothetical protein